MLWFCIATLCDWLKISRHFFNQSEVKPKPVVTYSRMFSQAWQHVFASSSDWFSGLFTTFAIGQSDYFGFGFTTLKRKPLYSEHDWNYMHGEIVSIKARWNALAQMTSSFAKHYKALRFQRAWQVALNHKIMERQVAAPFFGWSVIIYLNDLSGSSAP